MSLARLKPYYISLAVTNDDANDAIEAVIEQTFSRPVIEKSDDYVMAIERMEINLQHVPFYDAGENRHGRFQANTDQGDWIVFNFSNVN
jgi:hypothetical protein